jgi:hypothetical protein
MYQGKEYLFIDGYNIINDWDELKELMEINIEAARQGLVDILVEYQSYRGIKVILVFDAYKVKGNNQKTEKHGGLEIIYTKENETADTYIERVLDEIGRYRKVTVATSDGLLQQLIMSRGGLRMSAREFHHAVLDTKKEIDRKRDKISQQDVKYRGVLDSETLKKLDELRNREN